MIKSSWIRSFSLTCVALLLCARGLVAQGFERPGSDQGPTEIRMRVVVLDVDDISSANQNFTANVFFMARWQDDSLAHQGSGVEVIPLDEAWSPSFQLTNQQKVFRTFPEQLLVQPSGEVIYRQRVWGTFSQKLDLTDFPFDRQRFEVPIVASLPSLDPGQVVMLQDEDFDSGVAPGFSLPDWEVDKWDVAPKEYNPLQLPEGIPCFAFAFEGERHAGYYLLKLVMPLLLIVMMSWIVFFIDPKEMGTQVSVSVTSMLTLIAYRFMVGSSLPTISYLTRMDLFILCATLLVFTTLIEAVVTGTMARNDRLEGARRIDRVARFVFPAGLIVVTLVTLVS